MSTGSASEFANNVERAPRLSQIRAHPAMYIGSTDKRGLLHLFLEPVHNSIDEWLAGRCSRIVVTLLADGGCLVVDDGPGIPVHVVGPSGRRFIELAFSGEIGNLPAKLGPNRVDGGLRGVGLKCVAALSRKLEVQVAHQGEFWIQEYRQGVPVAPAQCLGDIEQSFTRLAFWPDPEIFKPHKLNRQMATVKLRELAYLLPGLRIELHVEQGANEKITTFHAPDGLVDFLRHRNRRSRPLHAPVHIHARVNHDDGSESIFDAALQWVDADLTGILSYANCASTLSGGSHVIGFRQGTADAFRHHRATPVVFPTQVENVLNGLSAIIAVRLPNPQYAGATKSSLNNPEVVSIMRETVREQLFDYLQSHAAEAEAILIRIRAQ